MLRRNDWSFNEIQELSQRYYSRSKFQKKSQHTASNLLVFTKTSSQHEQYLSSPALVTNNFDVQNFFRIIDIYNILLILDPSRKFGKILSAQGKNRSWIICRHPPSFFSFQSHLSRTGYGAFRLYTTQNRFDKLEPFLVGRLNFWRCWSRKIWLLSNSRKVLKFIESG